MTLKRAVLFLRTLNLRRVVRGYLELGLLALKLGRALL